jgi:site-specific DNA recombinase
VAIAHKRCAIYTRKSSEEGLEQSFNSLDAQREACLAYVASQRHEGWKAIETHYDDGGYSGGSMDRPALQRLLKDIGAQRVDVVVVYKVDRLTRSLSDFARMVELFDKERVSFVSVTQQFNTTTSMGRLTLNVLLSFAQFEREVTGERIRDKIAASKKKGIWMGGYVPLGYDLRDRKLYPNPTEAVLIRRIYTRYLELGCVRKLQLELDGARVLSKRRISASGRRTGGVPYSRGALYSILQNRLYVGEIAHRGGVHPGQHEPLVDRTLWDEVQLRLRANSSARRNGINVEAPSLLAGLVHDAEGHRLTPLHSTKDGKRYRYYTSQKVIRNGPDAVDEALRIPAHELDQLVLSRLAAFLRSAPDLLAAASLPADSASVQQSLVRAGKERSSALLDATLPPSRQFLTDVVARIVVTSQAVTIRLTRPALRRALGIRSVPTEAAAGGPELAKGDNADITLDVAARFRRLSGAVRMIVPAALETHTPAVNEVLLRAVVRGRRWYEMLVSGGVSSLHALAKNTGLHERYVSRILRCAFLAPDIVEGILDGLHPPHLTLDRLMKGVPADWDRQRRVFHDRRPADLPWRRL